jgi:stearoyl-CoA desaturase (delta-9 desaturase)
VRDLQQDPLVRWQHRYYLLIAVLMGFGLPLLLGGWHGGWQGALGSFLIAGVARVVVVNHMTFFINSWSHTWGRQPYSRRCSARDNAVLAWLTFGEGYHNFHHAFQHDYRNGVKAWHFDPTKWCIWLLWQAGMATGVRRVSKHQILLAEAAEQRRRLTEQLKGKPTPVAEQIAVLLHAAHLRLQQAAERWAELHEEHRRTMERRKEVSRERLERIRKEFREASDHAREAWREWRKAQRWAQVQLG